MFAAVLLANTSFLLNGFLTLSTPFGLCAFCALQVYRIFVKINLNSWPSLLFGAISHCDLVKRRLVYCR